MFGIDIGYDQAEHFIKMQKHFLILTSMPEKTLEIPPIATALFVQEVINFRKEWMEQYKPVLGRKYDKLDTDTLHLLTSRYINLKLYITSF